ncbi:MAG: hypothetical protein ACO1NQ_03340 [Flavobacteriales bacterium]
MKLIRPIILSLFVTPVAGQWEHTGPYGAWTSCHLRVDGGDLVGGTAGIFKSTDAAQTWVPLGSGLPSGSVTKLHRNGTVLYAGVDQEGLFRSLDEGITWQACNNAAMGDPYDIAGISSDGPDLLIACDQGRFRSTDQGSTFQALGEAENYPGEMLALGGGVLLTRTGFNFPGIVFRSTDGGLTWQTATTGMEAPPGIGALYVNGTDVYAIGRHVYRSSDQGVTWTQVTATPQTYSPNYSCRIGNSFYFSSDGNVNVMVSRWDLGSTSFVDIAAGLTDTWTTVLFGNAAGDVFINKNRVLYRSIDQGSTWVEQGSTGMIGAEAFSLLVDGDLVLCGSHEGIHRSTDAGATWQRVAAPAFADVTGFHKNGNTVLAAIGDGILRSTDGGLTWPGTALPNLAIGVFAANSGVLFAGGNNFGNAIVRRSTDGGATWSDFSSGLPGDAGILDLLATGGDVFAGIGAGQNGEPGVYKSNAATANWSLMNTGIEGLAGTALTVRAGIIHLGTENGVYSSADGGSTWVPVGTALTGILVNDLVIAGSNIIAATEEGIFAFGPGAVEWIDITDDLLPAEPLGLATGNGFVYAATQGRSVARRSLNTVGMKDIPASAPFRIGPNPVHDMLWILDGPTAPANLVIRDMVGREVMAPVLWKGQRIQLDVTRLDPGNYLLHSTTPDRHHTTPFFKD